ncbi:type II toxin-antitoxin system ParD family antitoxin [Belliella sp. DSM 107340]|uniref:Type II toxin-antitoxin system ParD family antitoxin n=1 Tax=Belliella calami TaxID=2923436 RepID=A0ABS9UJR4_9BACT|nr:type II toxin-antitoxin system ParD family antitoxin [Belliella calami]MCH7396859.1 type II toxin-antitoxin system ParD family antitoxin [Belliella calami]
MAKNTSILLGDYFDSFIKQQVQTGKYSSASEVVRAALRAFEQNETKKELLVKELEKGEKSGFNKNFDRKEFLETIHKKHMKSE